MTNINPVIETSWGEVLKDEFTAPYFSDLKDFLVIEKTKHTVYPPGKLIFNAFDQTPFNDVKVVILGQDPYHGIGQAHGLCFSVPKGIKSPPSLVNIFKELNNDLNIPVPNHGNLESWAKQGVFLLNTTLTVRAHEPLSHQGRGWERFTDAVISKLSSQRENLVFLLWGSPAQKKETLIDKSKHLILKTVHPSPLSVYRGFFGCRHFSQANEYLVAHGKTPINWEIE